MEFTDILKKRAIIDKIIFYALAFIFIGNIIVVTPTCSKYVSEKSDAVIYNNNLYTVNKGNLAIHYEENLSESDVLVATFRLSPNDIGVAHEDDKYMISFTDGCTLSIYDGDENVISNSSDYKEMKVSGEVIILATCPVATSDIKDGNRYKVEASIREQANNEDVFVYQSGYAVVASLPQKEETGTTKKVVTGEGVNVYGELKKWLFSYTDQNYSDQTASEFKRLIEQYIAKYESNVFDDGLPGLKIEKQSDGYLFTIEDNLFGYARTYDDYLLGRSVKTFYFHTDNEDAKREAFDYYLENYTGLSASDVVTVKKYLELNNFDIITYLATGTPAITGLSRGSSGEENIGVMVSRLLSAAQAAFPTGDEGARDDGPSIEEPTNPTQPVEPDEPEVTDPPFDNSSIPFGTREEMIKYFESYMNNIKTTHPEYNISEETINSIISNQDIVESAVKNNTESGVTGAFNDYFNIVDGNQYLLVKVYSDGVSNNMLEIKETGISTDMVSTFEIINNPDNTLNVNFKFTALDLENIEVTEEEIAKVKEIVTLLDKTFEVNNLDDLDTTEILKNEGVIEFSYQIQNQ